MRNSKIKKKSMKKLSLIHISAIAELVKGKTLVVIAHKLPAIMNADQICVMDHGKPVSYTHLFLYGNHPEIRQPVWNPRIRFRDTGNHDAGIWRPGDRSHEMCIRDRWNGNGTALRDRGQDRSGRDAGIHPFVDRNPVRQSANYLSLIHISWQKRAGIYDR